MSLKTNLLINRVVEFIKYDFNHLKYPLVLCCHVVIYILQKFNKHSLAFKIASNVYRTGWSGSDELGTNVAHYYFKANKSLGRQISDEFINNLPVLSNTAKFFERPQEMLNGIITVLKNPSDIEKGALIINYSYYFPLFIRFFDVEKIAESFNIILEPSWAGFCEENILSYSLINAPIFLQVYEKRDKRFIERLDSNIIPVEVGPSWFINHNNFVPPTSGKRDIDILMVAAWAKFKRHNAFFKALIPLISDKPDLKIVLVGYPVDMSKEQILQLANLHGIADNIEIYEWITPQEVSELQKRAKVNVLWSKFEGNNRAIIEGMFCDTPVIMRKGHNYGEHYSFINGQTGYFADEQNFKDIYQKISLNIDKMSPRNYVMDNRNCIIGTAIMSDAIKKYEVNNQRPWTSDLAVKVNDLHGMAYLVSQSEHYQASYSLIASLLKKNNTK
ncbi:MAG: glycosyltransferase [Paraglaciecola sp.]|uniref:glycosyltransferase n=1 Tax=Paraglaciecola sp. TaxID=1920173 RepID=UPI00273DFB29|nr:glycosyltransferase [Paraglaciecola sp.]MDP5029606.1 glycosyltransferase [Paraglaciecola sp.]MDP5134046.1 glycosyltransferase [Paraglaciecola sp.]